MEFELRRILDRFQLGWKDFADLRVTEVESTNVFIRKGEVDQVVNRKSAGGAARALVKGAWGFSYTTDLSPDGLSAALDKAIRSARAASSNTKEPAEVYRGATFEGRSGLRIRVDPREIPLEEKMSVALRFDGSIRSVGPAVATTGVSLGDAVKKERVANSLGTNVEYEVCYTRLSAQATVKEGDLVQNVTTSIGESRGWETIEGYDVENEGVKLGRRGINILSAKPPPSGRMNVIMDHSLVGVYIHEAFGHASEADAVKANRSILAGKVGDKVGSEMVTVVDDPTIEGARGSYPYDSEGTMARRRVIVERGVLKGFLHSLETAAFMNVEPNGAARAQDFSSKPIVRMSNTFVQAGDMTLEELAELIREGILLIESYGGYVDPARGQFYFTAQEGRLIRDGKICESTQNVSMSGLTLEVLQKTIGVGKEMKIAFPGTCGKDGQSAPVSGGGPYLAVRDIVVGGRGG
jgi:TldD protein